MKKRAYKNSFLQAEDAGILNHDLILEDVVFTANIGNRTDLVGKKFKDGIITSNLITNQVKVQMFRTTENGFIEEILVNELVPILL